MKTILGLEKLFAGKKHHQLLNEYVTAQKMKFSINDFSSKCDQICRKLRIWSHLLKKSLMENFIFCAVRCTQVFCVLSSNEYLNMI